MRKGEFGFLCRFMKTQIDLQDSIRLSISNMAEEIVMLLQGECSYITLNDETGFFEIEVNKQGEVCECNDVVAVKYSYEEEILMFSFCAEEEELNNDDNWFSIVDCIVDWYEFLSVMDEVAKRQKLY